MNRMLSVVSILMSLLALPAFAAEVCRNHLSAVHGTGREAVESSLKKEITEFRTLAERALALRAETIKAAKQVREKEEQGKPLTGEDLDLLNHGIVQHLAPLGGIDGPIRNPAVLTGSIFLERSRRRLLSKQPWKEQDMH